MCLAALLIAGAAAYLHLTRGTTLWFDDWSWALDRRAWNLEVFLEGHNGHFSLVPVAIYKVLFALQGVESMLGFRIVGIATFLTLVVLVYVYAERRLGPWLALCPAILLLFFGPGWQNILWPFQIGYMLSMIGGVGALLALDRGDRAGRLGACACLALSLASSGVGIPVLLGVIAERVLARDPLRTMWIVAVPAVPYAVWWLAYGGTQSTGGLSEVPRYVAQGLGTVPSAVGGFAHEAFLPNVALDATPPLVYPLAVVSLGLLGLGFYRARRVSPRVAGLLVALLSFWAATAISRGELSPAISRYVFVAVLFTLLLASEFAAGVRVNRRVAAVVGVATVAATASHVVMMREAAEYLRDSARTTRGALDAVTIARRSVPANYAIESMPGFPFVVVRSGAYFRMQRDLGMPAKSLGGIDELVERDRLLVDGELIRALRVGLGRGLRSSEGRVCRPGRRGIRNGGRLPADGALVVAGAQGADVSVGRFAQSPTGVGKVAARNRATVRIRPDASRTPWRITVGPGAILLACQ